MRWRFVGLSAVAAFVGAALACGGDPPASSACNPGDTVACACRGGTQGAQTCLASGQEYGACENCAGVPEGGAGESGADAGSAVDAAHPVQEAGAVDGGDAGSVGDAGHGDGAPLQCVDIKTIEPKIDFPGCDALDQSQCRCEGCTNATTCFDFDKKIVNDCVCKVCATDPACNDPARCNHDGRCDPYFEGCSCDDCAFRHPLCL